LSGPTKLPGVAASNSHTASNVGIARRHPSGRRIRSGDTAAHVLVHEIVHILERTDHHADSGVMKAQWNPDDYAHMMQSPLGFTEEDLQLIRLGLAARAHLPK
jgi:hypothetical protein